MTSEQLQIISADLRVMHGQAVMARTCVPVSVILDCLAADMNADEIIAEYTTVILTGIPEPGGTQAQYGRIRSGLRSLAEALEASGGA